MTKRWARYVKNPYLVHTCFFRFSRNRWLFVFYTDLWLSMSNLC